MNTLGNDQIGLTGIDQGLLPPLPSHVSAPLVRERR